MVDADRQFTHRPETVFRLAANLSAGPPKSVVSRWHCPPVLLVLNKIDKLQPSIRPVVLSTLERRFRQLSGFEAVFRISALLGDGLPALRQHLLDQAPLGKWVLPEGDSSDKSVSQLSEEIVREKLYRRFNQDIPYQLEPKVSQIVDEGPLGVAISQVIFVKNVHVRAILLGPEGSIMRDYVIARSRRELQRVLNRPVMLSVDVRVYK